jgi:phosphopantothenoylcysteine decarboxylase/phosphopantothenate--cysteine ligase
MARLLFGVTGGIAAYKMLETARLAIRAGHAVRVVQTPTSERFVGRASFAAITGAPVLTDEFQEDALRGAYPGDPLPERAPISHLALVHRADAYLIAPASANAVAQLAGGHASGLIATAALAADCPVLVAPAMNDRMYRHPAVQTNLAVLRERGVIIIDPGEGALASHGEHGVGRLAEPAELVRELEAALGAGRAAPSTGDLRGAWREVRVLVTAGGTREPIDAVRFIGNRSSGRMGYALAERAARRGAAVTLVSANVALAAPPRVDVVEVSTAAEMLQACRSAFPAADVLLMAAAVADFRPRSAATHKLKKAAGVPRVELEPTEDILAGLAALRRDGQILVGFAAEHGAQAEAHGAEKLIRKGLDAIVVNDVSQPGIGFDAADNEALMLTGDGSRRRLPRASKTDIADRLLDEVERLRAVKEAGHRAPRPDADRATRV